MTERSWRWCQPETLTIALRIRDERRIRGETKRSRACYTTMETRRNRQDRQSEARSNADGSGEGLSSNPPTTCPIESHTPFNPPLSNQKTQHWHPLTEAQRKYCRSAWHDDTCLSPSLALAHRKITTNTRRRHSLSPNHHSSRILEPAELESLSTSRKFHLGKARQSLDRSVRSFAKQRTWVSPDSRRKIRHVRR